MTSKAFHLKAGSPVLPAFFLIFFVWDNLSADSLARWTFENGIVDQLYSATSPEGYAPEEAVVDIAAGRLLMGAPNAAEASSKLRDKAHTIGGGGANCLDVAGWTETADPHRYVEISLQPASGSALFLDQITFQHGGNGVSTVVPERLDVSVRIGTGEWQPIADGLPVPYDDGSIPENPGTFHVSVFSGHPALQGITETVAFRFFAHGAGLPTSKWRIDDLTIHGTVQAPPPTPPGHVFEGVQIDPALPIGGLYHDERMNNAQPIITRSMFAALGVDAQGDNINGACVVRLPEWLDPADRADPSAVYYLYFAHHSGNYIRMAWAADIEGPWTLYRTGSSVPVGTRGVLDLGGDDRLEPGNGIVVSKHIASPDVLIDEENQQFVLFFHGPTNLPGPTPSPGYTGSQPQRTLVATSANGLNFNLPSEGGQPGHGVLPVSLGLFYFRVFEVDGRLHAFSNRGVMYRAPLGQDPFRPPAGFDYTTDYWELEPAPELLYTFQRSATGNVEEPRHVDYLYLPDGIRVFYTQVYGTPERVLAADISFNGSNDWTNWTIDQADPFEILAPEPAWEGGNNPDLGPSQNGSASDGEHAMRDPYLFADNGRLFLLYSGGGEDAIGLAQLTELPAGFHATGIKPATSEGWWNLDLVNGRPALSRIRAELSTTALGPDDFAPATEQVLLDRGNGSYRLKVRVEGSPQRLFIRARGEP